MREGEDAQLDLEAQLKKRKRAGSVRAASPELPASSIEDSRRYILAFRFFLLDPSLANYLLPYSLWPPQRIEA